MPTALIFGGSGKVARHLTQKLVSNSYTVFSIIRNQAQVADLESLGARPIVQSIEDSSVDDLAKTIKTHSPNVVIWAAGAGGGNPERTKTVDQEGAIKSFDATAAAGVTKRYIIVSAMDVRDRTKAAPPWYDADDVARSDRIHDVIGAYMRAKLAADRELVTGNARRGLEWTIVRPGGLTTEAGEGRVAAGRVHSKATVSREDVADVVVRCIEDSGTIGLAFDVVGGETPIVEAVQKVVEGKINTFEGFY